MKLLTQAKASYKIAKSDAMKAGYKSVIMYLAPANTLAGHNVCASSSAGCRAACLFTAGRGAMSNVQASRIRRTRLFFDDRAAFMSQLYKEIASANKVAHKQGDILAVRLNGTSDILWENVHPAIFKDFSDVQFYDYTKHFPRMIRWCLGELPSNYHLTFSRSENNETQCKNVLEHGGNVAAVFAKKLPKTWQGHRVFDIDKHDLRFIDPVGVGGLLAKGKARKDNSGFVIGGNQ